MSWAQPLSCAVDTMAEPEVNIEEEHVDPSLFKPVVDWSNAPEVEAQTLEDLETEVFKIRAKLFRFDKEGNQWRERGVGDVKILKHKENGRHRLLMRREKVFKICANHYLLSGMKLDVNCGSDRSWMWTAADFADAEVKDEVLAIRFANSENAQLFKAAFDAAVGSDIATDAPAEKKEEKKEDEKVEEKEEKKEEKEKVEEKKDEGEAAKAE